MYKIFCFSGIGNTWWVANKLKKALLNIGQDVSVQSIEEKVDFKSIDEHTHLVLGFPVYGSAAPYPMQNFIKALPENNTQKGIVSVFACHALASGDTGIHIASKLEEKGYSVANFKWRNTNE